MKLRHACALVLLAVPTACAYANGYDPSRYAAPAASASIDPEIEPLPPEPRRLMRDPRGTGSARPALARPEPPEAGVAEAAVLVAVAVPADAAAPADAGVPTCGTKADPCPMQRFMHASVASAHTADSLTTAFTLIAGMSPDPAWSWVAIATRGADLANAGNLAAAKGQCVACHGAYRAAYRAQYRMRPL